jgi:hypothetical protein
MTNPLDYFVHLLIQQLLICKSCKYALQPYGIIKHLQRQHKAIPLSTRKTLVEYAGTLTLRDGSTAITPVDIVPAFECLEIIPGYRCLICNFLTVCSARITMIPAELYGDRGLYL